MFTEDKRSGEAAAPEVGSRRHIVRWLETQSGEYFWPKSAICACGQYKKYIGADMDLEYHKSLARENLYGFKGNSLNHLASRLPWTFEALRGRCREVWGI